MISKEEAKERIQKLVSDFSENPKYWDTKPEEDIKFQFIEPLFEALGWERKEISKEQRVLRGRADYILKNGNQEVLVIEAKKTNVSLNNEEGKQAVSYAYHRKIKFSVLTNFKYLYVYHALSNIKDIGKNLLKINNSYFRLEFNEFLDKFDTLWLLSKESFEKGEINKLLSSKDEKLNKSIDANILQDLLYIRELLSKELKSKKNYLEKETIDEIIQILIDRLIFIRSVEDRGLEPMNYLRSLESDVTQQRVKLQLFPYLIEKFDEFNQKYDSRLFERGLLEKEGSFSDDVLRKVILTLYFGRENNQERYLFDLIPGDLFGSIYEQYLGTILSGTEKRVKLEGETGKRKKMGIYYTPSYIVEYIVKNTVHEYIKDKSIDEILNVKILDPACGSGSFITRAFVEVCNVIKDKLNKGEEGSKSLFKTKQKLEELNLGQKIEILRDCIHGVDLDEKAVELARLNLLLKLLEGENQETRKLLLPHLENNIKCGNSLIDDPKVSDRAFKWQVEFRDVMNAGGFDVVIGNPPYIKEYTSKEIFEAVKKANIGKYYQGKMDFWYLFTSLSLDLMKPNGLHSFIAQNNWITSAGASKLRNKVLEDSKIISFIDFNDFQIFEDASIQTMIYILQKTKLNKEYFVNYIKIEGKIKESELRNFLLEDTENSKIVHFQNKIISRDLIDKNITFANSQFSNILKKIKDEGKYHLKEDEISTGIDVHQDFINDKHLEILKNSSIKKGEGIFILSENEYQKIKFVQKEKDIVKPFYTTGELFRYYGTPQNHLYVIYSNIEVRKNIKDYPHIKEHLDKFKKIITSDFAPYGIHRAREQKFFEGEKIISLRKTVEPYFTYTTFPCYVSQTYFVIKTENINLKYLTGLLNSNLIFFWLRFMGKRQGNLLQIDKAPLMDIPIRLPPLPQDKKIISLVDKMLELQKRYHDEKISGNEKERLEQQIKNIDYEIDEEAYKLYGITEEEKRVIEESLK